MFKQKCLGNLLSKVRAMSKSTLAITLVLCLLAVMLPTGIGVLPVLAADKWDSSIASSFAGGNGTVSSPYQISSGAQLAYMAKKINNPSTLDKLQGKDYSTYSYKLMDDIDLNDLDWTPISGFKGTFDGNSKTISNLKVTATEKDKGFFATLNNATVKNLTIKGSVTRTNGGYLGGFAGKTSGNTTFENCTFDGTIFGSGSNAGAVGGFVGCVESGTTTLTNSSVIGDAISISCTGMGAGGFVGRVGDTNAASAIFTNCKAENLEITAGNGASGFVGHIPAASTVEIAQSSAANCTITAIGAGGLVGYVNGSSARITVSNSVVESSTVGNGAKDGTGGMIGSLLGASATVTITGSEVENTVVSGGNAGTGGLVGYVKGDAATVTITGSGVQSVDVIGTTAGIGGLLGENESNGSSIAITTSFSTGTIAAGVNQISGFGAGGLVGYVNATTEASSVTITNCYSTMNVTSTHWEAKVGGLVGLIGENDSSSTVSLENCHFAGFTDSKKPIAHNQGGITAENVYYREDSYKGITPDVNNVTPTNTNAKQTKAAFADGTVTALLGSDVWVTSPVGYPVFVRQKQPDLSELKVNGVALNVNDSVHNLTVDDENAVITATADDELSTIEFSAVDAAGNTVGVPNGIVALAAGQTTTVTVNVQLNSYVKSYTLHIYRDPVEWNGTAIATQFSGGQGTQTDPYLIATAAQLAYLSQSHTEYSGCYFELIADIDLDGCEWTPIGSSTANFNGTFDGQDHVIRNLTCTNTTETAEANKSIGLFGYLLNATIKNVHVVAGNLTCSNTESAKAPTLIGGIAAKLEWNAHLENCSFDGDIKKTGKANAYVGGLVGMVQGRTHSISGCGSTGTIASSVQNQGGLVGLVYSGTIGVTSTLSDGSANTILNVASSYSAMDITASTGITAAGGLFGAVSGGMTYTNAGRIVRTTKVTVSNSHFAGTVNRSYPICNHNISNYTYNNFSDTVEKPTTANLTVTGDVYYKEGWYTGPNATVVASGVLATEKTAAEFADGTLTDLLGAGWATSTSGYPVRSDLAGQFQNALDFEGASVRTKGSVQGIRFKFSITNSTVATSQLRKVGILVAKESNKIVDDRLYAHKIAKEDTGYYTYANATAHTRGGDKSALIDDGDKSFFAAVLYNFDSNEKYATDYLARAYATFTDAKGQEVIVYSRINNKDYNSVYEVVDHFYNNPNQGQQLGQSDLLYLKKVFETRYTEVLPQGNSAEKWNPQEGGADDASEALRQSILNTEDDLVITGTTYYISPNGDDENDGLSPQTAWRNVDAINLHYDLFEAGDAILFERGGVYRSLTSLMAEPVDLSEDHPAAQVVVLAKSGVTYGAYGDKDLPKPAIYSCHKNYAWDAFWTQDTNNPNIWKVNTPYSDAGLIVFNHGEEVGIKRMAGITSDNVGTKLSENFEFYHDHAKGVLYLYLEGNSPPNERFDDIEICPHDGIFIARENTENVTIDNLAIKYTGFYGVRAESGSKNVTVTNCELGWIGGCEWEFTKDSDGNRIGNAIEFWHDTENALVQNNWIYQVFDAGITPQGTDGGTYRNIQVLNNLVEYCTYNIEWFDRNPYSVWDGFRIEDNIFRFAGYGWGSQRADGSRAVANIAAWDFVYETPAELIIQDNVFDCAAQNTVYWTWNFAWDEYTTNYPNLQVTDQRANLTITGNTFYDKSGTGKNDRVIAFGSASDSNAQKTATNQTQFENAIKAFDTAPKHIEWLG